jgi:hypothetical protein
MMMTMIAMRFVAVKIVDAGGGNSRDNDVDERLFKTLRTAPMALPPPAGVPAMSSAPSPKLMEILKERWIKQ